MRALVFFVLFLALTFNVASAGEPTKQTPSASAETPNKAPSKAANLDAAKKMFADVCSKCHGPTARGMASFPRLSDKKKDYLVGRLKQYRAGEKVGPNTPLMAPHAVKLSDAEIDSLATYISTVLSTK